MYIQSRALFENMQAPIQFSRKGTISARTTMNLPVMAPRLELYLRTELDRYLSGVAVPMNWGRKAPYEAEGVNDFAVALAP